LATVSWPPKTIDEVVEAGGAGIMMFGGLGALVAFALGARRAESLHGAIPICAAT